MTLKNNSMFGEKLTFCLQNDIMNLINFNYSSGKPTNLYCDWIFCQKYVMLEVKITGK